MGPSKTQTYASNSGTSEASTSKSHTNKQRPKKHINKYKRPHVNEDLSNNALPGVQKIKAALRQTRRLLAKEKLAADVRVATERKQRALEADLAQAERTRKERAIAQKYHMIKFFERQKTVRRLKQASKRLEDCTDKKERKKLEKELFDIRVDLNYILNYPKLEKYISLYPPEVRQQDGKGKHKESDDIDESTPETDRRRAELRKQIRGLMQSGELSMEPENHLGSRPQHPKTSSHSHVAVKSEMETKRGAKHVPDIGEDAFFGEESGDEEEAGGGEGDEMDED